MKTAYLEDVKHIVIKDVDKPSYGPVVTFCLQKAQAERYSTAVGSNS
jgi:hypothetical protein